MFKELLEKKVYVIVSGMAGTNFGGSVLFQISGQVLNVSDDVIVLRVEKFDSAFFNTKFASGKNAHIPVSKIISIIEL